MKYLTTKEIAQKWNISERRVRVFCDEKRIKGAHKIGRAWNIPFDAKKPIDARLSNNIIIPEKFKKVFDEIDNKKSELDNMRPLTTGEVARLQEEFMIEFTYNSNAIEGNTLTLQETAAVLKDNVTIGGKPLKDHLEAIGHKEAFKYIEQLVKTNTNFTEKIIKQIHSLVLMDRPEDRGIYRKIPVQIMGAIHTPPQPYAVPQKMKKLIGYYKEMKKTVHTIERIALFHLIFEGIHPFVDGNGRTGRLIMNLELIQNGYPNISMKFSDRQKYYKAFDCYFGNDDSSPMINLIAGYLSEALDEYLTILS